MHMYWTIFSLGAFISLIGYIWLAVVGFKRNVVWGLLVLLFSPLSAVIFAAVNWREARNAFLVYAVSMVMVFGAAYGVYSRFSPLFMQVMQRVQNGELSREEANRLLTSAILNDQTSLPPAKTETADKSAQAGTNAEPDKTADKSAQAGTRAEPGKPVAKPGAAVTPAAGKQTQAPAQQTQATDTSSDTATDQQDEPAPIPRLSQVQPDPLAQKRVVISDTERVSLSRISHYLGRFFIITLKDGSEHRGILREIDATKLVLDRKLYGGNFVYRIRKDEIKTLQMLKRTPEE